MVVVEVAGTQKVADPRAWGGDCDKDRMMSVAEAGVELMTATYDTSNLRSSLKEGATERLILKDGVEEMAEYDAANVNTRLARYDHDPSRIDGLLSQTVDGTKVYFVTDALGSVYAAVQEDGTIAHRASYDAYGAKNTSVDASGTPWGYTGRRHDSSTGLKYYRSRYYDSSTGTFPSRDRVGISEGIHGDNNATRFHHPYVYGAAIGEYAGGAPTNITDPMGLFSIEWHKSITWAALSNQQWKASAIRYMNGVNYWIDTIHQPDNEYHAMRDSDETREHARMRWLVHVNSRVQRAARICGGDEVDQEEVYELLAEAFHAVQDHVAHPNFPTWYEHYWSEPDMGNTDKAPTQIMITSAYLWTTDVAKYYASKINSETRNRILFGFF